MKQETLVTIFQTLSISYKFLFLNKKNYYSLHIYIDMYFAFRKCENFFFKLVITNFLRILIER